MTTEKYCQCVRCIMDTTDPDITFDEKGYCNHCTKAYELLKHISSGPNEKKRLLEETVRKIKEAGKGKRYDCIIGLSGGVDSSYVAYLTKKLGLQPLAVHLDNAWNSELAVKNIENIVTKLDIDLYTHILDWDEFRDLQLSFLKASVPDAEIPTDHAIVTLIYQMAAKEGIKHIISGTNVNTESILPSKWSAGHMDWRYIKSVQKRFGTRKLKSFPHLNFWEYYFYYPYVKKIKSIRLLDLIDYHKERAMEEMSRELGWKYYGGKHYESVYTRFFQSYILPNKFTFDKRKAHLSSLICSGEIDRQTALKKLKEPICDPSISKEDKSFVIKKLGISGQEFEKIMQLPHKFYGDYPSYLPLINILRPIYRRVKNLTGFNRKVQF